MPDVSAPAPPPPVIPVTTYPAILGAIVRLEREARGMRQAALASALGVNVTTYSKYENGAIQLSAERLHAVSESLGVAVATLTDRAERVRALLVERNLASVLETEDARHRRWTIRGRPLGALAQRLLREPEVAA